jgi:hypothetical protein
MKDLLLKNSKWTWNQLRDARTLGYQLGEESITDFLVLNLKKNGGKKFFIKSFTRHAESLNGADWEWWLTGSSGLWLGMRIQAKIINFQSLKYEHLYHRNKHGYQADLLIKDANRNGVIPLYCLYTNWDARRHRAKRLCWNCKPSIRHYGTSILSANIVRSLLPYNIIHLDFLYKHLMPMHCILCPKSKPATGDLPERSLEYLQRNKLIEITSKDNGEKSLNLLQSQPPLYVTQLLDKQYGVNVKGKDFYEKVETDLPIDDLRLKHITIIKEKLI